MAVPSSKQSKCCQCVSLWIAIVRFALVVVITYGQLFVRIPGAAPVWSSNGSIALYERLRMTIAAQKLKRAYTALKTQALRAVIQVGVDLRRQ